MNKIIKLSFITFAKHVTFHVSRHTNATLLLSLGVSIEIVAKQIGHSDIKTTAARYVLALSIQACENYFRFSSVFKIPSISEITVSILHAHFYKQHLCPHT